MDRQKIIKELKEKIDELEEEYRNEALQKINILRDLRSKLKHTIN